MWRWLIGCVLAAFCAASCGALPCNDDDDCPQSICHVSEGVCLAIGMRCIPGISRQCYPNENPTKGIGECQYGKQLCSEEGQWGNCIDAILPQLEICDDKDNDCDGQVDEGCDIKAFCDSQKSQRVPSARLSYADGPTTRQLTLTLSNDVVWDALPQLTITPNTWKVEKSQLTPADAATAIHLQLKTTTPPKEQRIRVSLKGKLRFPKEKDQRCDIEWDSGQLSASCPTGQRPCDAFCIDPQSNNQHCGNCGQICTSTEQCTKGRCIPTSCPPDQTLCGESCVNTKSNQQHCGQCDKQCTGEGICLDGTCAPVGPKCLSYERRCGGRCTDVSRTDAHCGRCELSCQTKEICIQGKCRSCPTCPLWGRQAKMVWQYIATDDKHNIYIAGTYQKETLLGQRKLTPIGKQELVVAKLTSDGEYTWVSVATAPPGGIVRLRGLAVDPKGTAFVVGDFTNSAIFGKDTLTSKGLADGFVAAISPQGTWRWAKAWGGTKDDRVTSVDSIAAGELVVAVTTRGNLSLDNKAITHKGNPNNPNVSVVALSDQGIVLWHYHFKSEHIVTYPIVRYGITGSVYITGTFRGLLPFGGQSLVTYTHAAGFVAKLASQGRPIWIRQLGNSSQTSPLGMAVDAQNRVVVTGTYGATIFEGSKSITPQGGMDVFVAMWDDKGDLLWLSSGGGRFTDRVQQVTIDSRGQIFVIGSYQEEARYGEVNLQVSDPNPRGFVAQINDKGQWVGAAAFLSKGLTQGTAITSDNRDAIYMMGTFEGVSITLDRRELKAATAIGNSFLFKLERIQRLCYEGNQTCAGVCATTESSQRHCGACGQSCKDNEQCIRGQCKPCPKCAGWLTYGNANVTVKGTADVRNIALDSQDNIFIVGRFTGALSFGGVRITAVGASAAYIAKLDKNGRWIWAKALASTNPDIGQGVAVDDKGDVYWTGQFRGATTFAGKTLPKGGLFVCKLTTAGKLVWVTTADHPATNQYNIANDIVIDAAGNAYVTGKYYHKTTFGTFVMDAVPNKYNAFVAKLNTSGNWQWVTRLGGTSVAQGNRIALGPQGNVYLIGLLQGKATFAGQTLDGGVSFDAIVAKVDANGKPLWARRAGDFTADDRGQGLAVNAAGVYISGHFSNNISFGNQTHKASDFDTFVAKLDHNGNWGWSRRFGNVGYDYNRSIRLNQRGELFVTGEFRGSRKYNHIQLDGFGQNSIYILHLDANGQLIGGTSGGGPDQDVTFAGAIADSKGRLVLAGHTSSIHLYFQGQLHKRTSALTPTPFVAYLNTDAPCPTIDHKRCGQRCTHIKTDNANCGQCGTSCTKNQQCTNAVCQ